MNALGSVSSELDAVITTALNLKLSVIRVRAFCGVDILKMPFHFNTLRDGTLSGVNVQVDVAEADLVKRHSVLYQESDTGVQVPDIPVEDKILL